MFRVRVIIQNCDSLEYVAADESWCTNPDEALAFDSGVFALEYMRGKTLGAIQIVLKFEQERFDLKVSKSEGC
ncbi:MAG: hypothetical protein JWQ71_2599 [Pedosphaera sp.]|nr:hypothetical protein [Pedosphaera sp.]